MLQTEKSHSIVVKDIPLLSRRQKLRRFDTFDRNSDHISPNYLIRSEHYAVAETRINDPPQILVKLRALFNFPMSLSIRPE
jgi:hypothetical protein